MTIKNRSLCSYLRPLKDGWQLNPVCVCKMFQLHAGGNADIGHNKKNKKDINKTLEWGAKFTGKDHRVCPTLQDKPKMVVSFTARLVESTVQLHAATSERANHKTGPGIQVVALTQTAARKVQLWCKKSYFGSENRPLFRARRLRARAVSVIGKTHHMWNMLNTQKTAAARSFNTFPRRPTCPLRRGKRLFSSLLLISRLWALCEGGVAVGEKCRINRNVTSRTGGLLFVASNWSASPP